jgi:hypothetical protein
MPSRSEVETSSAGADGRLAVAHDRSTSQPNGTPPAPEIAGLHPARKARDHRRIVPSYVRVLRQPRAVTAWQRLFQDPGYSRQDPDTHGAHLGYRPDCCMNCSRGPGGGWNGPWGHLLDLSTVDAARNGAESRVGASADGAGPGSWSGKGWSTLPGCISPLLDRHPTARGVADAVRCGWADVGVCLRLTSEEAELEFLGPREESSEICYPEAMSDARRIRPWPRSFGQRRTADGPANSRATMARRPASRSASVERPGRMRLGREPIPRNCHARCSQSARRHPEVGSAWQRDDRGRHGGRRR